MPAEMIQALTLRPEILRVCRIRRGCLSRRPDLHQREVRLRAQLACVAPGGFNDHQLLHAPLQLQVIQEPLRERLAIEYTRAAMADSNRVPDSLFDQLREQFSDADIKELTS
jgi:hypothetical protein